MGKTMEATRAEEAAMQVEQMTWTPSMTSARMRVSTLWTTSGRAFSARRRSSVAMSGLLWILCSSVAARRSSRTRVGAPRRSAATPARSRPSRMLSVPMFVNAVASTIVPVPRRHCTSTRSRFTIVCVLPVPGGPRTRLRRRCGTALITARWLAFSAAHCASPAASAATAPAHRSRTGPYTRSGGGCAASSPSDFCMRVLLLLVVLVLVLGSRKKKGSRPTPGPGCRAPLSSTTSLCCAGMAARTPVSECTASSERVTVTLSSPRSSLCREAG